MSHKGLVEAAYGGRVVTIKWLLVTGTLVSSKLDADRNTLDLVFEIWCVPYSVNSLYDRDTDATIPWAKWHRELKEEGKILQ